MRGSAEGAPCAPLLCRLRPPFGGDESNAARLDHKQVSAAHGGASVSSYIFRQAPPFHGCSNQVGSNGTTAHRQHSHAERWHRRIHHVPGSERAARSRAAALERCRWEAIHRRQPYEARLSSLTRAAQMRCLAKCTDDLSACEGRVKVSEDTQRTLETRYERASSHRGRATRHTVCAGARCGESNGRRG